MDSGFLELDSGLSVAVRFRIPVIRLKQLHFMELLTQAISSVLTNVLLLDNTVEE